MVDLKAILSISFQTKSYLNFKIVVAIATINYQVSRGNAVYCIFPTHSASTTSTPHHHGNSTSNNSRTTNQTEAFTIERSLKGNCSCIVPAFIQSDFNRGNEWWNRNWTFPANWTYVQVVVLKTVSIATKITRFEITHSCMCHLVEVH